MMWLVLHTFGNIGKLTPPPPPPAPALVPVTLNTSKDSEPEIVSMSTIMNKRQQIEITGYHGCPFFGIAATAGIYLAQQGYADIVIRRAGHVHVPSWGSKADKMPFQSCKNNADFKLYMLKFA